MLNVDMDIVNLLLAELLKDNLKFGSKQWEKDIEVTIDLDSLSEKSVATLLVDGLKTRARQEAIGYMLVAPKVAADEKQKMRTARKLAKGNDAFADEFIKANGWTGEVKWKHLMGETELFKVQPEGKEGDDTAE